MKHIEEELYRMKQSRDTYKQLYEKERSTRDGKPVFRETDRTRLLALRDFINELLERWDKLGEN